MKKIISPLFLAFMLCAGSANAAPTVRISNLNCSGAEIGVGGGTVTYTGSGLFNLTEYSAIGMPFSQQAKIMNVSVDEKKMSILLQGLTTGIAYKLDLYSGTYRGQMTTQFGSMALTCISMITF
jgi:hypothetical protein